MAAKERYDAFGVRRWTVSEWVAALPAAIEKDTDKAVNAVGDAIEDFVDEDGHFPDAVIEAWLAGYDAGWLRTSSRAWHLVSSFGNAWVWCTLDSVQRQRVWATLERHYPAITDWMHCFIITEHVGGYIANADGIAMIDRLVQVTSGIGRRFLPHGYRDIATTTTDLHVRETAARRVLAFLDDPEEETRCEAELMVEQLISQEVLPAPESSPNPKRKRKPDRMPRLRPPRIGPLR